MLKAPTQTHVDEQSKPRPGHIHMNAAYIYIYMYIYILYICTYICTKYTQTDKTNLNTDKEVVGGSERFQKRH